MFRKAKCALGRPTSTCRPTRALLPSPDRVVPFQETGGAQSPSDSTSNHGWAVAVASYHLRGGRDSGQSGRVSAVPGGPPAPPGPFHYIKAGSIGLMAPDVARPAAAPAQIPSPRAGAPRVGALPASQVREGRGPKYRSPVFQWFAESRKGWREETVEVR